MYLGVGTNTLLAEIMSDSTVLDNLSINGLLAEIAHTFLSAAILKFNSEYQTKNKHGQQSISAIRAQFFMRIRCRVHTVYRIFFLPISKPI